MSSSSDPCERCCDRTCDAPETLYATIVHLGITKTATLKKWPKYWSKTPCGCNETCIDNYIWQSGPLLFYDDSVLPLPEHLVCCMNIAIVGNCSPTTGLCEWIITVSSPDGGQSTWTGLFESCDPISKSATNRTFSRSACIQDEDNTDNRYTIAISETDPGGDAIGECDHMCCSASTVYLTIDAPDCPKLHGKVIEMSGPFASGQYHNDGTEPNIHGEMGYSWVGYFNCGCDGSNRLAILNSNTWSDSTIECRYTLTLGVVLVGSSCFSATVTSASQPYCFPIEFSGELDVDCDCCPFASASVSSSSIPITVTVSE